MALGPWQIAIIALIALLVFGRRGKISFLMGDIGKGITSFRKALKEGSQDVDDPAENTLDITSPQKD